MAAFAKALLGNFGHLHASTLHFPRLQTKLSSITLPVLAEQNRFASVPVLFSPDQWVEPWRREEAGGGEEDGCQHGLGPHRILFIFILLRTE
jgi:hypothetical protein